MTQTSTTETQGQDEGDVNAKRVAYAACRLTPREHARAEAAATLEGARYFSSFVRQAVLGRADRVLERESNRNGGQE